MDVTFKRTGERRYGLIVTAPGQGTRQKDPAPGYDDHIPHDLVHYVVEAELGLAGGVFGRIAGGGGGLFQIDDDVRDHRERRRQARRQRRREDRLRREDHAGQADMATSETYAGFCLIAWKRRHGYRGEAAAWLNPEIPRPEEDPALGRILDRLDRIAPLWNALPVGGSLTFRWPGTEPVRP
ncbi:hypothetical protein DPM19_11065 [Actinomadura craniellae]|uniref:Uncharacterized protein n=1 Tax=Actinomadura craniellae TaxID=2231787 RepID=A0A365H812_9ACTN|nr:hypothetical protein [Actinomadura craniellae]RAY15245.1 hypothetical protein DPM19_11065 [Actinomadura craniellae]